MARTTIKDIARACDVSLSTVSLVLNNNPRISEETRQKVQKAIARFEYQPNVFASSLASKSSRVISVVVPHLNHVFSDVYFGEIVSGVYERATELEYKVLLDVANHKFTQGKEFIRMLKSRRVDGMVFIGSSIYDDFLLECQQGTYPFVLVNHFYPDSKMNFIAADYMQTGRMAADHLLNLRHKRIGLISGSNTHTARLFNETFTKTCSVAGLGDIPWADGWFTEQGGYEGAEWLLSRHPNLTAIMAGNDKMAMGAMRYLLKQGIKVPKDISVMGVDDIPSSAFCTPGLTTIRHDLFRMGQLAVEAALDIFRKKVTGVETMLPVELMLRESTGPAKAK